MRAASPVSVPRACCQLLRARRVGVAVPRSTVRPSLHPSAPHDPQVAPSGLEAWLAGLPATLPPRLDEPCVTEWGFGAGPSFMGLHVEGCMPRLTLREGIGRLFERRGVWRRAHLRLADGTRLLFEPSGRVQVDRAP